LRLLAYFDESGTQTGAPVLAVGGCIAAPEAWNRFAVEWQQATTDYGLDHFHMTEFENRQGSFRTWPNHRRIHRLNRLLTIINRHTIASAGMSVDRVAYERIISKAMKERLRGPYGMALKGVLASLKRLSKTYDISEPIEIVFAFGADQESKYFSVRFERQTHLPPLQAADVVVYDMVKEIARILGHHTRGRRRLMKRLDERYKYWGYLDEDELNASCR
jgi:hypothetical protein